MHARKPPEAVTRQADEIAESSAARIRTKYVRGQLEHGGNLFEKPVLHEAIHEAVDLFTYLYVLERQHRDAIRLLEDWIDQHDQAPSEIVAARNLLATGNIEGCTG